MAAFFPAKAFTTDPMANIIPKRMISIIEIQIAANEPSMEMKNLLSIYLYITVIYYIFNRQEHYAT